MQFKLSMLLHTLLLLFFLLFASAMVSSRLVRGLWEVIVASLLSNSSFIFRLRSMSCVSIVGFMRIRDPFLSSKLRPDMRARDRLA